MQTIELREEKRLQGLRKYEDQARKRGYRLIAGVDEAGRGPLAGPVVAVACVLPPDFLLPGVDDSKKLTPKQRELLYAQLAHYPSIQCGVGIVEHDVIDTINIYQASIKAMLMAVSDLPEKPDFLFVDGMKIPSDPIPCEKVIGGDGKVLAIAVASIIAKVTRDRMMSEYHEMWPEYGFDKHKGYPTAHHLKALEKYGPCSIHRLSYAPVKRVVDHL